MSLYLEDCQSLLAAAEYNLNEAIYDRKNSEYSVSKDASPSNKRWLAIDIEKEKVMRSVINEYQILVELAKDQEILMNQDKN